MTGLKLILACALLLTAGAALGPNQPAGPAQPFWELQGAGPGARETGDLVGYRSAARQAPAITLAAR